MSIELSIAAMLLVGAFTYLICHCVARIWDVEEKLVEMEIRIRQLEGNEIVSGRGHQKHTDNGND